MRLAPLLLLAAAALPAAAQPAQLPGNGLAQHDFFYAGESKRQRMFIVRAGAVVWSYEHNGKGEISDAVLEPNGHVLFAHQFGITEIDADKKVLWHFPAPAGTEIHTAQRLPNGHVIFVQNGDPARVGILDPATLRVVREFNIPVRNPKGVHGHFRHARLTPAGHYLVAHMDLGRVVEYDLSGKALWSVDAPGPWSAEVLANNHVLVVCGPGNVVKEFDRDGRLVWSFAGSEAEGYQPGGFQTASRLPNGNTLINAWFNEWNGEVDRAHPPIQALEVTPDKRIVWALRAWGEPVDLGPSTTIQILRR